MKTILHISILFYAIILLSPQQTDAQVKLGAGAAFASDIEQVGVQGDLHYRLSNQPFQFSGSLLYYFPKDNHDFVEANLNGAYIFYEEFMFKSYLYTGLNLARSKVNFPNSSVIDRAIGLNIGAGAEYDFGPILGFGDLKYVFGEFNQPNFSIGLRFQF
ncbi:MAG: hypothetical protein U5K72_03965 [Balneolaceae bacterium]|nr:hypothetical protein [Balneolaceae bacterium]